ncbi:hypothetical protein PMIN03_007949 [Paraphaeosphaeria minitans]
MGRGPLKPRRSTLPQPSFTHHFCYAVLVLIATLMATLLSFYPSLSRTDSNNDPNHPPGARNVRASLLDEV